MADPEALLKYMGTRKTAQQLGIPSITRLEEASNPKEKLIRTIKQVQQEGSSNRSQRRRPITIAHFMSHWGEKTLCNASGNFLLISAFSRILQ